MIRFQEGLETGGKYSAAISFGTEKNQKENNWNILFDPIQEKWNILQLLFQTEANYTQESKNGKT